MFCPECGKKNAEEAKFCEFCGAKIVSEEKVILPKKSKVKISKKNKIIIIVAIILVLVLGIGGFVLSNNFKPSKVAVEYFLATTNGNTDGIYDFINIPENEFTTKEVFEKVNDDLEEDIDLVNYQVVSEDISSDGLSAQVKISYTVKGRQTPSTETIYLVKDSKNKFLIFPNWKISEGSSLVREDYEIKTYKDSTLKLEGITVDKKYLKDDDKSTYDIYVIPAIFKGDYDVDITLKNGLVAKGKLDVNNYSSSLDNFEIEDKKEDELENSIKDVLSKLYESAINKKSFDDIKADFEYDGADLTDLEDAYDNFALLIGNGALREYNLKDIEVEKISITEDSYLSVTVKTSYDYAAKAYLSDDNVNKSDDDTVYLTFDYNEGFKLVDMSSLATSFSRF